VASVAVPLYLSEIGPPKHKNRLGIANQGFIVLGVFTTQALAIPLSRPYLWRIVPLVSAVLSSVLLITSCLVDESPAWARKRDQHSANATLGEVESLLSSDGKPRCLTVASLVCCLVLTMGFSPTRTRSADSVTIVA
jgi:MFS family permease